MLAISNNLQEKNDCIVIFAIIPVKIGWQKKRFIGHRRTQTVKADEERDFFGLDDDVQPKGFLRSRERMGGVMDLNEITYAVNGAVFEVNRVLGHGFLEKVYENALMVELNQRGLKAASQVSIKVFYKGEIIGEYWADIVVEDQVIIEIKCVEELAKIHEAQLLHYLKATGFKVGLLVNFTSPRAEIKRLVL